MVAFTTHGSKCTRTTQLGIEKFLGVMGQVEVCNLFCTQFVGVFFFFYFFASARSVFPCLGKFPLANLGPSWQVGFQVTFANVRSGDKIEFTNKPK